ncbi:Disks large -like protein 1, partial [Trichinella papuae]
LAGLGSNQTRSIAVVTTMPVKKQEAHRALELLEEYHKSLIRADDRQLREAIERVITIFKCRLFQALLEIQEFYEETLLNEHKSLLQKTVETNLVADRWEGNPPIVGANASNKTTDSYASFVDAYKKSTSPTAATSTISSFPASLRGQQRELDSPGPFYTSAPSAQPRLFNSISQPVRDSWQDDSFAADSRYTNGSHDDNWEYEEIILEKGTIAGLGFSISGGRDNPHVADDPSIYVTKIIPGGAAAYDGRLRKDDIILRVNQIDTTDVYHHVAVDALKQAGNIVKLFVRRRPRDDDATTAADCAVPAGVERRIELLKGNKGLGFSIAGGLGNEHVANDAGIYVTKIIDGGAAQVDGRLSVGDKLLAVGNCSLDNVTHETAVAALKATADRVVLTVLKPISGSTVPFADGNEPGLFDTTTTPTTTTTITGGGMTATAPPRLSRQQEMRRAMGAGAEDALSASASSSSYTPYALPEPTAVGIERRHSVGAVFGGEPGADAAALPGRSPRRVTLNKGGAGGGLGFNIVGGEDGEGIYISYILPGGVADVSGLLHKGDQLLEVNGVDLRNATHEEAAAALKSGGQKIYILAAYRPEDYYRFEAKIEQLRNVMIDQNSPQPRRELYVRALFDYDPSKDSGLPSRGLAFNYGDILHVTNACDDDWWQARKRLKDGTEDGYGIIPSKRRLWVEKRERSRRKQVNFGSSRQSSMSEKHSGTKKQLSLSRKFPFMKSKERLHEELENERLEDYILSYQPVEQHYLNYVRPVIVLGALKDRINDDLTAEYPDNFACCVPHTSRPRREHEVDGRDYYFVSREVMEHDIHNHLFIEAGQYNGNLYGTSIGSVRDVSEQNKHCILDVSGNAIKRLQLAGLYPIVIFIKPYGPGQLMEWNRRITEDDAVRVYQRCLQIEQEFGESFTAVVQGDVPEEIYERVKEVIRDQSGPVVWVPSQEGL